MSEPPSSDASGSGNSRDRNEGFGSLTAGALSSLLDHLEARADLFRWEARQAKSDLLKRLGFLLLGILMIAAAYGLAIAALVGWLSVQQGLSWPVSAGLVALGHLILGAALLLLGRRSGRSGLFPDSIAELHQDREALRRRSDRTRPQNPS